MYQLIRNLLAPAKPTDKTFTQIVEAVEQHLQPRPSVIVQRFNFHSRSHHADENISTYIAELHKLLEYCAFGDTLNDMLRDRLVCGINDQRLQRRLLAEPTLTFEKAWELAQASETAERKGCASYCGPRSIFRVPRGRGSPTDDRPPPDAATVQVLPMWW